MINDELKQLATEVAFKARSNGYGWQGAITDMMFALPLAEGVLRLLEEAQGEIVKACPRCGAFNPVWLQSAGCFDCLDCSLLFDELAYYRKIQGPQR